MPVTGPSPAGTMSITATAARGLGSTTPAISVGRASCPRGAPCGGGRSSARRAAQSRRASRRALAGLPRGRSSRREGGARSRRGRCAPRAGLGNILVGELHADRSRYEGFLYACAGDVAGDGDCRAARRPTPAAHLIGEEGIAVEGRVGAAADDGPFELVALGEEGVREGEPRASAGCAGEIGAAVRRARGAAKGGAVAAGHREAEPANRNRRPPRASAGAR